MIVSNHVTLDECKKDKRRRQGNIELTELQDKIEDFDKKLEEHKLEWTKVRDLANRLEKAGKSRDEEDAKMIAISRKMDMLETSRDKARIDLDRFMQKNASYPENTTSITASAEKAEKLAAQERRAANRVTKKQMNEVEIQNQEKEEKQRIAAKKLQDAKIERKVVAQRDAKKKADLVKIYKEESAIHETKRADRVDAIMNLKKSTEKVHHDIASANKKRIERERIEKVKQDRESKDILAAGGNPYEVFRQRKHDQADEKTRKSLQQQVKHSQTKVAEDVIEFDKFLRAKTEEERKQKEELERKQNALGRHVAEENRKQYIKSRTVGGVESVDPGGRAFRVEPSQVTTIKTHAFGLGTVQKSRKDIVDLIHAQPEFQDVEPSKMLIPSELQRYSDASLVQGMKNAAIMDGGNDSSRGGESIQELIPGDDFDFESDYEGDEERQLVKELPNTISKEARMSDSSGSKKFQTRSLSKLERQMLEKARKRQKDGIVQDQIVCGRKFSGQAFVARPEVVRFKDFVVGETYKFSFTLTNGSNTFNTFKLLDLTDALQDYFTISYVNPGKLSGGLSCRIDVEFRPELNEDLFLEIPFLAKTGPFSVPVICSIRRVTPTLSSQQLDFGSVPHGEKSVRSVKILNEGSLPTNFQVATPEGCEDFFQFSTKSGKIDGYAHEIIRITYVPKIGIHGASQCDLDIKFTNEFNYPEETLKCNIVGTAVDVPVYVESKNVDFHCVCFDRDYNMQMMLKNRSTGALRYDVQVPNELKRYLEVLPVTGFVQGREPSGSDGAFPVQIKLSPTRELVEKCKSLGFVTDEMLNALSIPVEFCLPSQALPVRINIVASLTSSEVSVEPSSIDFGECYISQASACELRLSNAGLVPQTYGFVNLKPYVSSKSCFGTILPLETLLQEIQFSPNEAKDYEFILELKTSMNQILEIPCRGVGIEAPVQFSDYRLIFGAIGLGGMAAKSFVVTNVSSAQQVLEFEIPPSWQNGLGLMLAPAVSVVEPGQSVRVEVEFTSPKSKPETDPESDVITENVIFSEPPEPWSMHIKSRIACHIKNSSRPLFLEVETTTIDNNLLASADTIQFGVVPLGNSATQEIDIKNNHESIVRLEASCLNAVGAFTIVNALRDISPGNVYKLIVKFTPDCDGKFMETIKIKSDTGGMIRVQVHGESSAPTLSVSPQKIDLGHHLVNDIASKKIQVANTSALHFNYSVRFSEASPRYVNADGTTVFAYGASTTPIQEGETKEMELKFRSDREMLEPFVSTIEIETSRYLPTTCVEIRCQCWATPLFACMPVGGHISRRDTIVDAFLFEEAARGYTIEADFDQGEEVNSLVLAVGSCSDVGGDFEIVLKSPSLEVSTPKGSIGPYASMEVKLKLVDPKAVGVHRATCTLIMQDKSQRVVSLLLRKRAQRGELI